MYVVLEVDSVVTDVPSIKVGTMFRHKYFQYSAFRKSEVVAYGTAEQCVEALSHERCREVAESNKRLREALKEPMTD